MLFPAFPQFFQRNDRLEPVNISQLVSSSVQFIVYSHTAILPEMVCDLKISAFELSENQWVKLRAHLCWNQIREVATSLFSNNLSKIYTASKF